MRKEWKERQRRLGSLRELDQEDRKNARNLGVPVLNGLAEG